MPIMRRSTRRNERQRIEDQLFKQRKGHAKILRPGEFRKRLPPKTMEEKSRRHSFKQVRARTGNIAYVVAYIVCDGCGAVIILRYVCFGLSNKSAPISAAFV